MEYDRNKAVAYAHEWAYGRNPKYFSFNGLGGDCTNFISQCLYAGCEIMNYTRDLGWYYKSAKDRAAAWTGVEQLHKFLISNQSPGPYAEEAPVSYARPGDIIQLSFDGKIYAHSLFVVEVNSLFIIKNILVATHTDDSDNRPLNSYNFRLSRLLHIAGVRS